jgi:hypothetical protein
MGCIFSSKYPWTLDEALVQPFRRPLGRRIKTEVNETWQLLR